jgi:hypothetical protein
MNINQQTLINFSKVIISSYLKLLFIEAPEVSLTISEGTTEITDTIISVKSIVPNDGNDRVPLISPLEYQLTYPDCNQ